MMINGKVACEARTVCDCRIRRSQLSGNLSGSHIQLYTKLITLRIYGFQAYLIRVLLPSPVTNLTNVLSEFCLESAKPLGVCLLLPRAPSFSLD